MLVVVERDLGIARKSLVITFCIEAYCSDIFMRLQDVMIKKKMCCLYNTSLSNYCLINPTHYIHTFTHLPQLLTFGIFLLSIKKREPKFDVFMPFRSNKLCRRSFAFDCTAFTFHVSLNRQHERRLLDTRCVEEKSINSESENSQFFPINFLFLK